MKEFLFYFFATLTLAPAFFTAISRKPVNAAMNMLLAFVGVAGLLGLLETYFLAILQVMVYAGAIVVLFLFIVMLIDAEKSPAPKFLRFAASLLALVIMVFFGYHLVLGCCAAPYPELPAEAPASVARVFGESLFTRYLLPFQLTGFMLLIAMVGVIVICRKPEAEPTGGEK
jgi:NADH-quinone oxidoreductase subunit J